MTTTHSPDLATLTDAQLVKRSAERDERAFEQIVRRYQSLVCSVAFNRCGDLALSEDLAQEAFILAWQKLDELTEFEKFKAWICTIVRNLAGRAVQRRSAAGNLDAVPDVATDVESPVERAASEEEQTLVWQALAELPENYREPLILFYREEHSVARVAESLDLSEDAVKQRLSRGRKMLQEHLAATVESVLTVSKPGKKFTSAVLAGVAGLNAKTAAAGTAGTASAATIATTSGLGSLWLGLIVQLPVLGWLYKTSYADMRTEQERRLWRRFNGWALFGLVVFAIPAMFSTIWWQHLVKSPWLRGLLMPGIMILYMIPMVICGRRFGRQIEQLRHAAGEDTTPKPLVEPIGDKSPALKTHLVFSAGNLFVIAWPAALTVVTGNWPMLAAMLTAAILAGAVAAQLGLRYPARSVRAYQVSLAITALLAIGIMVWRRELWEPAFGNYLFWYTGVLQSMTMSLAVLSVLAWKRSVAKPK